MPRKANNGNVAHSCPDWGFFLSFSEYYIHSLQCTCENYVGTVNQIDRDNLPTQQSKKLWTNESVWIPKEINNKLSDSPRTVNKPRERVKQGERMKREGGRGRARRENKEKELRKERRAHHEEGKQDDSTAPHICSTPVIFLPLKTQPSIVTHTRTGNHTTTKTSMNTPPTHTHR